LFRERPQPGSRISNGGDILPDVDGRSAVARRYRDIAAQIITDIGGASQCGEAAPLTPRWTSSLTWAAAASILRSWRRAGSPAVPHDPAHAYGPPGERAVMPGGKGMRQSGLPHRSISLLQEFYSRSLPLA
jgi:hypothetical protein